MSSFRTLLVRDLRLAVISQQAVDLLLYIRQLCIAEPGNKSERSNSLHEIVIHRQKLLRIVDGAIKLVEDVALLGRDAGRNQQEASDFREHNGLAPVTGAEHEERLITNPDVRRQCPSA